MTMTNTPAGALWDDERIQNAVLAIERSEGDPDDPFDVVLSSDTMRLCREICNSYEQEHASLLARIAELERQLVVVSKALAATDSADRYYRGFNAGYDCATEHYGGKVPPEIATAIGKLLLSYHNRMGPTETYTTVRAWLAQEGGGDE